ncbi:MAG TPA: hypothetical protein VIU87_21390 [Mycobacterium sp.]
MMPLANIAGQGHEVRWATGRDSCDWIATHRVPAIIAGVEQRVLLAGLDDLPAEIRPFPGWWRSQM